jgi:hypothetical protein
MRLLLSALDVVLQFAVLCWRKLDDALLRRSFPPPAQRPFSAARLAVLAGLLLAPLAWAPRCAFRGDMPRPPVIHCPGFIFGPPPHFGPQLVALKSTLLITSEPAGARIISRIGRSKRACSAPCEVTAPAGARVELEARLPGYATWRSSVVVGADQILRAELRRAQLP